MADKSKGYIKLYRSFTDHWLWKEEKPVTRMQAWLDLLMLANYKATKFSYKEEVIDGEAGTVYRSMSWLAERWGWSRKKVRRFLNLLQNDRMVDVKADRQGTTISIVNYEDFQGGVSTGVSTDVPTRVSTRVSTDDPHTRKIKKDKEGKESKEKIEPDGSEDEDEDFDFDADWDNFPGTEIT